jgi:hypothetical protein
MDAIAAAETRPRPRDPWSHQTYPALTAVIIYDEPPMTVAHVDVVLELGGAKATYVLTGGYPWRPSRPTYRRDEVPATLTFAETRRLSYDANRHRLEALRLHAIEENPRWRRLLGQLSFTEPASRRGQTKQIDMVQAITLRTTGKTVAQVAAQLDVSEKVLKEAFRRLRRAGRL